MLVSRVPAAAEYLDCPGTAKAALLGDVSMRVFDAYPDSTVVYPGHGDDTTLGAERPSLNEWRERGW